MFPEPIAEAFFKSRESFIVWLNYLIYKIKPHLKDAINDILLGGEMNHRRQLVMKPTVWFYAVRALDILEPGYQLPPNTQCRILSRGSAGTQAWDSCHSITVGIFTLDGYIYKKDCRTSMKVECRIDVEEESNLTLPLEYRLEVLKRFEEDPQGKHPIEVFREKVPQALYDLTCMWGRHATPIDVSTIRTQNINIADTFTKPMTVKKPWGSIGGQPIYGNFPHYSDPIALGDSAIQSLGVPDTKYTFEVVAQWQANIAQTLITPEE